MAMTMAKTKKVSVIAALATGTMIAASSWAMAQDLVQAGVSAAVRGDVQVARSDAVGRQVNSSEPIYLQDAISSGTDSGMQILLLDETVFTIGPESEMAIDEFVYDPNTGEGSLAANMTRGVMRFVTGNISDGAPENMTIQLPVGTIGIRGTIGVVAVLTEEEALERFPDQASQLVSGSGGGGDQVAQLNVPQAGAPIVFAALVGPGPLTQTNANVGSFNFSTPNGDVDLNRPNSAVLASPNQPPLIFLAPPGSIQGVTNDLTGGDSDGSDQSDSSEGSEDSGSSDQAGTTEDSGDSGQSDSGTQTADGSSTSGVADQSGAQNDVGFSNASGIGGIPIGIQIPDPVDDAFTFRDLAGLSGSANFPTGSYGGAAGLSVSNFEINYSSRTFFFNASVNGGGIHTNQSSAASISWSNLTGNAVFTLKQNSGGNVSAQTGCSVCEATITFNSGTNVSVSATGTTGTTEANVSAQ